MPKPAAQLGKAVHETLETLVREHLRHGVKRHPCLSRVHALWMQAFVGRGLSHADFHDGRAMLVRFLDEEGALDPTKIAGVEVPFEYQDDGPEGGYRIRGVIDRIDVPEPDVVEVIDYKTGRWVPTREEVERDLQLSLYALVAQRLVPGVREVRATLRYLRPGVTMTTTRTAEQLLSLSGYLVTLRTQIGAETEFAPRLSNLCSFCEYRQDCSGYQDALEARALPVDSVPEDLDALGAERERVASTVRLLDKRKRQLDGEFKRRLDEQDELVASDRRYRLITTSQKRWDLDAAVPVLAQATGREPSELRDELGTVDKRQLDSLLAQLKKQTGSAEHRMLRAELDAVANETRSQRLSSTRVARKAGGAQ